MKSALVLLLIAAPALAWEPATPQEVQARITELEQAWQGKDAAQIAQDKIARARQKKPQWASKGAWKMELGALSYYFAVGKASGTGVAAAKAPAAQTGRPIDWWYDDAAGVFYTLVVDAR
jgi:Tfp pilus assembly protein FimV